VTVILRPIDRVRPSAYNPRHADPARLDVIELSLRKLGWLLPIYADPAGEIISGHQRHLVAERMGYGWVPVETMRKIPLERRKAINIAFNRGTNDLRPEQTPAKLTDALDRVDLAKLTAALPNIAPDSDEAFPLPAPNEGRADRAAAVGE